jgi:hypothetical protein
MAPVDDGEETPSGADGGDEAARLRAENEALRTRLVRRMTWRRWLAAILVVLTVISAVTTTVAVWAHNTVFDTDQFMETVDPALDDPALYSRISAFVSEETLAALDIENRLTDSLTRLDEYLSTALLEALEIGDRGQAIIDRFDRPSLAALALPLAEALESRITARIDGFFTSEEFKTRLPELVRRVHEASIALVRGDLAELPNVYIEAGEVRLNLIPIIADALRTVGDEIRGVLPDFSMPGIISDRVDEGREQLAAAVRAQLPDDFGQVTVMTEDQLGAVQDAARRLDRLVWGLLLLTIVFAVLSVVASPNRRRTVIQLGLGIVAGLVVGWLVLRRLQEAIFEQITSPDGLQAARALVGEVMSSLRTLVVIVGVVAVVFAVAAYLAGRPPWVQRLVRRGDGLINPEPGGSTLDRWLAAHHDALRVIGIAVAAVVLLVAGIDFAAILLIGGALAIYLWALSVADRRVGTATVTTATVDPIPPIPEGADST